jgi:hypothetical protein
MDDSEIANTQRSTKRRRVVETNEEDIVKLLEGSPNISPGSDITEHDLTPELLKKTLVFLATHWTSKPDDDVATSMPSLAAKRFNHLEEFQNGELVPYGRTGLQDLYKKKQLCLVRLQYHFVRLGIMELDDAESSDDLAGAAFRQLFIKIHESMRRLYDCLLTNLLTRKCLDPQWASDCPTESDPYNIVPFDITKLQGSQAFLVFVIDQLQKYGLRRYKGACYEQIESPPKIVDGRPHVYKTHAWRRFCDISEFVNRCAPKETHFAMWQLMVTGDTKSRTIKHLEEGYEIQFEDLQPDRHWHSFPNGVYNTNQKMFFPWSSPHITADITSCKYHDAEFPEDIVEIENWHEIPTPHFDKILNTQLAHVVHTETDEFGAPRRYTSVTAHEENERRSVEGLPERVEEGDKVTVVEGHKVIDWAYILLGRLLFEVNEKDQWQVMPMFVGRAGTGKSLIGSTVRNFFDEGEIGLASNDQQKGFGLETIYDSKLWMVKEVKHDFSIDQAQLQSMITGEEMSIQRKNKTALQVVWRAPGILLGNELPNWVDNSGSMSRRMILFYFHKRVPNVDPYLADRLKQELPSLMHKCNRAYARAVTMYGSSDIWSKDPILQQALQENPEDAKRYRGSRTILPSYFHMNKLNLKQQTHLMENFLANKDQVVVLGASSGRGMPYEKGHDGALSFKDIANAYFKKQDVRGGFPWSKTDRYMSTFDDYNIEIRPLTLRDVTLGRNRYANHDYPPDTMWMFGVVPKTEDTNTFD